MAAFEAIAKATPSGTGTVTFSSIPSTYEHLQIRMFARNTDTAASRNVLIELNGSASTIHSYHVMGSDGSSASISQSANDTFAVIGTLPAASSLANSFGAGIIDIVDYTNTNKNKTVRGITGYDSNGTPVGRVEYGSFLWASTAAITSVRVYFASGNYTAGSVVALFGYRSS